MYSVTVRRDFIARHYLTVPDPGPEGELHSQHYRIDCTVRGPELDAHNYLVDIDALKASMTAVEQRYADATLNDLPEFDGNPSVERFARIVWDRVLDEVSTANLQTLRVRIWEDEEASAGYEREV